MTGTRQKEKGQKKAYYTESNLTFKTVTQQFKEQRQEKEQGLGQIKKGSGRSG